MAFDQFDIIGALRTYCTSNNILFIWHYDEFEANIEASVNGEIADDQLILVVDLTPAPVFNLGSKVAEIAYSGLFMLGKKFDADGQPASPEEFAIQKYDRRLLPLSQQLAQIVGEFKCLHELDVEFSGMTYIKDLYDANIDFVADSNITFTQ